MGDQAWMMRQTLMEDDRFNNLTKKEQDGFVKILIGVATGLYEELEDGGDTCPKCGSEHTFIGICDKCEHTWDQKEV